MTRAKPTYDCSRCPAYCCSYDHIDVTDADLKRLAKHFGVEPEVAEKRYTKFVEDHKRVLRHKEDEIYGTVCRFLDQETRRCTIYEARPHVCRTYPENIRCGYYEFLKWEREYQGDDEFVPFI